MSRFTRPMILALPGLALFGLLLCGGAGAQQQYDVPKAKAADWDRIQQEVDKDLEICREHCGGDTACLAKCDQVDAHRRKREHQRLMSTQ